MNLLLFLILAVTIAAFFIIGPPKQTRFWDGSDQDWHDRINDL